MMEVIAVGCTRGIMDKGRPAIGSRPRRRYLVPARDEHEVRLRMRVNLNFLRRRIGDTVRQRNTVKRAG